MGALDFHTFEFWLLLTNIVADSRKNDQTDDEWEDVSKEECMDDSETSDESNKSDECDETDENEDEWEDVSDEESSDASDEEYTDESEISDECDETDENEDESTEVENKQAPSTQQQRKKFTLNGMDFYDKAVYRFHEDVDFNVISCTFYGSAEFVFSKKSNVNIEKSVFYGRALFEYQEENSSVIKSCDFYGNKETICHYTSTVQLTRNNCYGKVSSGSNTSMQIKSHGFNLNVNYKKSCRFLGIIRDLLFLVLIGIWLFLMIPVLVKHRKRRF